MKPVSIRVVIITLFNIMQFVIALISSTWLLSLIIGIPLLIINFFLFKKSKPAYILMLVWFGVQSITFNFENFAFSLYFGYFLDIHIFNSPVGFNPLTIVMFFILLSVRKKILTEKRAIVGQDMSISEE